MSLFEKIVNPDTGRKVSIYSQKGRDILNNYVQHGGTNPWTNQKWSSYSCEGLDREECNNQPNNRCKFSEKGNYCRKTQSSSKKRGKKNWGLLKKKNNAQQSNITIANIFSQEGKERRERQEKIESLKRDIIEKENEVTNVQDSLQALAEELGMLKKQLNDITTKSN